VNTTPCTSVTASAAPPSPSAAGTPVTITASAVGCPNPRYRFWVEAPGGPWTIQQDYSAANTFTWSGTGQAASYNLEVDARDAIESVSYDVVTNFTYQLSACSAVALGASPASPQAPGATILLTATGTCAGTPTYRFWVRDTSGAWSIKQDYSTASTYSWPTAGLPAGVYGLEVDIRGLGSTDVYQKVSNLTYRLGVAPCVSPALGASPLSPGPSGTSVVFTASTSGCPSPRYRFWVEAPGGRWTILQDYGAAGTFNWTGTGSAGAYAVEVDVRDQAETVSYDAVKNLVYVVAGCTAATLTTSPAGTAPHGTPITLTGTSVCPGAPAYRFWIRAQGGSWTVVQDYGATNTFTWSPSTPGTYYLEVDVRDQGATTTYERVSNLTNVVS
jgi:hypothetical protein